MTERVRRHFRSREIYQRQPFFSVLQILWASNRLYAHAVAGEMNRATWVFGCIGLCLMSEVSKAQRHMHPARLTCTPLVTAVSRGLALAGVWHISYNSLEVTGGRTRRSLGDNARVSLGD